MKCSNCEREFEFYKRIPQDPSGNYCPHCSTFQRSDYQIEQEEKSLAGELPENVRTRLLTAIDDLLTPIGRLISVQQEIERLPDAGNLQTIRGIIESGQSYLATAYHSLTQLSGVQECR